MGRTYKTVWAASSSPYPFSRDYFYTAQGVRQGRLQKRIDPDNVITLFNYASDSYTDETYEAIDVDQDEAIGFSGLDRVTRYSSGDFGLDLNPVGHTATFGYFQANDVPTILSESSTSADGLTSMHLAFGNTRSHVTARPGNGYRLMTDFKHWGHIFALYI